ncbi:MAG: queuosine salvage family protein [bacterium]|nr:queuosine salvage family protein [bacterium]
MNLEVIVPDPLQILTTTKFVVDNARSVFLDEVGLESISKKVEMRLGAGLETAEAGFGASGDFVKDVQLIFLLTVTNFCFWAEKDQLEWQVLWKDKEDGFYSLAACFQRALIEFPKILDASYLAEIKIEDVKKIFRSDNGVEIPLILKRMDNLREAGVVLNKKYNGLFVNAMETANFDAIEIAKLLYREFVSFQDTVTLDGRIVNLLKRAQIGPNDLSYLSKSGGKPIGRLDQLTAFADYKIPQILREVGVLKYSGELMHLVDNYILIESGSREEVEIRAATIWGVELIRQKLKKYSACEIDNALWLLSLDLTNERPYHRTYTIYY